MRRDRPKDRFLVGHPHTWGGKGHTCEKRRLTNVRRDRPNDIFLIFLVGGGISNQLGNYLFYILTIHLKVSNLMLESFVLDFRII